MNVIRPYPVHLIDGVFRHFACLASKPDHGGLAKFAAAEPTIPRAQWTEVDLRPLGLPLWNQRNHGSCVGHGSGMAFTVAYKILGGTLPDGGFSPTSLYSQINGGRDMGAVVSDAMTALLGGEDGKGGIGLMADVGEDTIYARQISAAAKAKYARFRVAEAYHLETFDEMATAIQRGYAVSFGITIRSGFNRPGKDGLIEAGGYPLGGHCMCVVGLIRLPGGRWVFVVRNSWGETFAVDGDCLLPEEHFRGSGLDAFAIKAARSDPEDPDPQPAAV